MSSMALKKRGEISPQLLELRTPHTHTSHQPPFTPVARAPGHHPPPAPLELTTTPNTTPHARTQTPPTSCDRHTCTSTSRTYNSGPSVPSEVNIRKNPLEVKDIQVKSERLSISPVAADSSGSKRHPLVTTTKAVGRDQRELLVTKEAQNQPPQCHRDTTPPLPASSHAKPPPKQNSDATSRVHENESESDAVAAAGSDRVHQAAGGGGGSAEEARIKRQEQQRLQKEKWQLKHGLSARRPLGGTLSPGEGGDGVGGASVHSDDDLVSAGKTNYNFYVSVFDFVFQKILSSGIVCCPVNCKMMAHILQTNGLEPHNKKIIYCV